MLSLLKYLNLKKVSCLKVFLLSASEIVFVDKFKTQTIERDRQAREISRCIYAGPGSISDGEIRSHLNQFNTLSTESPLVSASWAGAVVAGATSTATSA